MTERKRGLMGWSRKEIMMIASNKPEDMAVVDYKMGHQKMVEFGESQNDVSRLLAAMDGMESRPWESELADLGDGIKMREMLAAIETAQPNEDFFLYRGSHVKSIVQMVGNDEWEISIDNSKPKDYLVYSRFDSTGFQLSMRKTGSERSFLVSFERTDVVGEGYYLSSSDGESMIVTITEDLEEERREWVLDLSRDGRNVDFSDKLIRLKRWSNPVEERNEELTIGPPVWDPDWDRFIGMEVVRPN